MTNRNYPHINPDLELEIRRGFSSYLSKFQSLELWADNFLSEICRHAPSVYDYKVRIKTIESLLKKINTKLKDDPNSIKNFHDVINKTRDIVGARIITNITSTQFEIHKILADSSRVEIEDLRIHCLKSNNGFSEVYNKIEKSIKSFKREENETGYHGIHYILKPTFDGFYENSPEDIYPFDKIELQIRTILNHAWSETQHKLVYKDEDITMKALFKSLSVHVNACDTELNSLVQTRESYHPTSTVSPKSDTYRALSETSRAFIKVVNQFIVDNLDNKQIEDIQAIELRNSFIKKYKNEINQYESNIGENALVVTQLAELYLKTYNFEKAIFLYKTLLSTSNNDADQILTLRLAEALAKNKEIKSALEVLRNKSLASWTDKSLLLRAAYLVWSFGSSQDAIILCKKANELLVPKDFITDSLKIKNSLLFYKMENNKESNQRTNYPSFVAEHYSLCADVLVLEEIEHEKPDLFTSERYDTLAYFYLEKGNIHISEFSASIKQHDPGKLLDIDKAELKNAQEAYEKAKSYHEKCWSLFDPRSSDADTKEFEYSSRKAHINSLGNKIEKILGLLN